MHFIVDLPFERDEDVMLCAMFGEAATGTGRARNPGAAAFRQD
jgi:hypothetical protein